MYHSAASGNQLSYLEAEHPLLPENVTATWEEVAQSESSALHRFCQKCLYVNDSMSHNLQSQLMPVSPPDRTTTFISDTFNVPVWATQSAVSNRGNDSGSFLLFDIFMCREGECVLNELKWRFSEGNDVQSHSYPRLSTFGVPEG